MTEKAPRKPLYLNTRTLTSHLSERDPLILRYAAKLTIARLLAVFGPYVWFPIISAFTWLGGLLALLGLWVHAGKPRYMAKEASVVFISDVGATYKTLFICICVVTVAFYVMALLAERWLRHVDRLPSDMRKREHIFDWLAIFFGIVGSAGLILLSCFDAFNHSTIHWSMTIVFVVGVAISAIFQSAEVWSLHKDHPDRSHLLRNSKIKLAVVILAVLCAIAFGATYKICGGYGIAYNGHSDATCNKITSASSALEWTVAFILFFYFLTLVADLWPAGKSSPRYMRRLAKWQEKHGEGHDFTGRGAFGEYPERWRGATAAEREQGLRQEMEYRNTGGRSGYPMAESGRPSEAGSQIPMMQQV
ncbi:hypothetical protein P7C73_g4420, partial [Tremellales sp. Uapishka_1]